MKRVMIIVLCGALLMPGVCGCSGEKSDIAYEENTESGMRRTTLYYATDDGYVVPVMKSIPWEEGIGKAALSYLVSGEDNDRSAAAMGLQTVIPEGTRYTLRIDDSRQATLDLIGCGSCGSRDAEQAMVTAIVNTLSEFETIDTVRITVDGRKEDSLPMGTDISAPMKKLALNVEEGALPVSGKANRLTLYFPNISASLNIPVTRYTDRMPSFAVAVGELVRGTEDSRLLNCFPEGTELLRAYIDKGIASVDFSGDFSQIDRTGGRLEAARDAIYLCANEFEEVYGVDIYVEGNSYSPHTEAVSVPVYVNEFR